MLVQMPDARSQLRGLVIENAAVPEAARAQDVLDRLEMPVPGVEVVLAILGDWHQRSAVNLPLLAKLWLVEAVRRMAQMGFQPRLALVPMCSRAERVQ
jgi:hypothetical protein